MITKRGGHTASKQEYIFSRPDLNLVVLFHNLGKSHNCSSILVNFQACICQCLLVLWHRYNCCCVFTIEGILEGRLFTRYAQHSFTTLHLPIIRKTYADPLTTSFTGEFHGNSQSVVDFVG